MPYENFDTPYRSINIWPVDDANCNPIRAHIVMAQCAQWLTYTWTPVGKATFCMLLMMISIFLNNSCGVYCITHGD